MVKSFCGYVALMGRPNVGKSTLLNTLLGSKISITSRKPQTTRHRILGISTQEKIQTIYVDTPGMHENDRPLNQWMNKQARSAISDVDVVLLVVDSLKWTDEDQAVLNFLKVRVEKIILVVNKVDTIEDRTSLLDHLKWLSKHTQLKDVIPVSAKKNKNIKRLKREIQKRLPESVHYFPDSQLTDKSERFQVAEIIREKIVRMMGMEIPHTTTIEIEQYQKSEKILEISAIIWVEREGQKAILIGKQGERLKKIGTRARMGIEKRCGQKVHLRLWVKLKKGWSHNDRALKSLGYTDE